MTDLVHPRRVLADLFTLQELQSSRPRPGLLSCGNANNVVNSWLELAEKFHIQFVFSCPPGYEPHSQILDQAMAAGRSQISSVQDPLEAVRNADVIYTDVWPELQSSDTEAQRNKIFKPYQVNELLLKEAKPDCLVMHRLPANRGEEITRDVLDGKHSIVLKQAENRLHVQKGIMVFLLKPTD
jgi:ornithine carbamoyltransferase